MVHSTKLHGTGQACFHRRWEDNLTSYGKELPADKIIPLWNRWYWLVLVAQGNLLQSNTPCFLRRWEHSCGHLHEVTVHVHVGTAYTLVLTVWCWVRRERWPRPSWWPGRAGPSAAPHCLPPPGRCWRGGDHNTICTCTCNYSHVMYMYIYTCVWKLMAHV